MRNRHLSLAIIRILYACSVEKVEKLGPENSWWLGGIDGGVFVKITDDARLDDDIYSGVIYF